MKKAFFGLLGILLCTACQKNADNIKILSDKANIELSGKMLINGDSTVISYYELFATDSFCICLDRPNDTLFQAYNQNDFSQLSHYGIKGQGPNDFLFPFFIKNTNTKPDRKDNQVSLVDIYTMQIKHVNLPAAEKSVNVDTETVFNNIMHGSYINLTKDKVYGTDIDCFERLFFIYDKDTDSISSIAYYPISKKGTYDKEHKHSLYTNSLCVNENKKSVVSALKKINAVLFYDLAGNLNHSFSIGRDFQFPDADGNLEILDFPNSPTYFVDICGTENFVYCLYDGSVKGDIESKIYVFSWDGKHIQTFQLDGYAGRIAVTPSDKMLYALTTRNNGETNLFCYTLPTL